MKEQFGELVVETILVLLVIIGFETILYHNRLILGYMV